MDDQVNVPTLQRIKNGWQSSSTWCSSWFFSIRTHHEGSMLPQMIGSLHGPLCRTSGIYNFLYYFKPPRSSLLEGRFRSFPLHGLFLPRLPSSPIHHCFRVCLHGDYWLPMQLMFLFLDMLDILFYLQFSSILSYQDLQIVSFLGSS